MDKKDRELLRVYDQEGQHKTFAVPNEITCADVVVMFGKKILGFQASQFVLCVEHKGVTSMVNQQSFPYSIAKELEADAPDDKDRKTGVSKVKFYLMNVKNVTGLHTYEPTHSFNNTSNSVPRRPSQAPRKSSDSAILRKSGEVVPRRASDSTTVKSGTKENSPRGSGEVIEVPSDKIRSSDGSKSADDSPKPFNERAGLSAYLLKKNISTNTTGTSQAHTRVWVVFRNEKTDDPVLEIFASQEDATPQETIHLVEAKYTMQTQTQEEPENTPSHPTLTIDLPNKQAHVFTGDQIQQWYEVLHQATKICKPQSPSLVFAHPRPAGKRGSVTPPSAVNANELLKRRTLNGLPVTPTTPDPVLRDRSIIAWANFCCSKTVVILENIIQDLHNGAVLATLVEVQFESKVFTNRGRSEEDFKYNVALCLDVLRILGVPTSGLFAQDILECKQPRILLDLLWNMFFYFVAGADEPTVRERLCEWCKSYLLFKPLSPQTDKEPDYSIALTAIDTMQFQDGIVYAAMLNKFSPDSIDFAAVVQQERSIRMEGVLSMAEEKLRVPKGLTDSGALADEKISLMYLGLLYVAISDSYKWQEFLKRIRPPIEPMPAPQAPASISILPPEPKPNFKTPMRKLSSTPNSLARTTLTAAASEENKHKAELSSFKFKHVAKSPPSKAPPPPSVSVAPQLKKTDKLPALLVAEGFQSSGSVIVNGELGGVGEKVQKPAQPTGKVATKLGAKPSAKPTPKTDPIVSSTPSETSKVPKPSEEVGLVDPDTGANATTELQQKRDPPEVSLGVVAESQQVINTTSSVLVNNTDDPDGTRVGPEDSVGPKFVPEDSKVEPEDSKVEPETPKVEVEPEDSKVEPEDSKAEMDNNKVELDEETDEVSDNSYDDSSGSDSGGDLEYSTSKIFGKVQLKNVQVEFQKDMRTREGRIKEMKRWRTSNAIPHADSLGPILSREQAIKAGHYFEDADADARERYGREPSFSRPPFTFRDSTAGTAERSSSSLDVLEGSASSSSHPATTPTTTTTPATTEPPTTTTTTTSALPQAPTNDGCGTDDQDASTNQKEPKDEEPVYNNRNSHETNEMKDAPKDKPADKAENELNNEIKDVIINKPKVETNDKDKEEPNNTKDETTYETKDGTNNGNKDETSNKTNENNESTNGMKDETKDQSKSNNDEVEENKMNTTDSKVGEEINEGVHQKPTEDGMIGADTKNVSSNPIETPDDKRPKPPKVIIRVTLEGFGDTQFRSFAIDPKTVAGAVCCMVAEKMKFTEIEVPEYGLFVVKNGLERLLDADEVVMTAEVSVEKFVYKRNYENEGDRDRKLYLSLHRSHPFKFHK